MFTIISSKVGRRTNGGKLYLPYLTEMAVHAVIALWSPHAELTLVGGTVHHSG